MWQTISTFMSLISSNRDVRQRVMMSAGISARRYSSHRSFMFPNICCFCRNRSSSLSNTYRICLLKSCSIPDTFLSTSCFYKLWVTSTDVMSFSPTTSLRICSACMEAFLLARSYSSFTIIFWNYFWHLLNSSFLKFISWFSLSLNFLKSSTHSST